MSPVLFFLVKVCILLTVVKANYIEDPQPFFLPIQNPHNQLLETSLGFQKLVFVYLAGVNFKNFSFSRNENSNKPRNSHYIFPSLSNLLIQNFTESNSFVRRLSLVSQFYSRQSETHKNIILSSLLGIPSDSQYASSTNMINSFTEQKINGYFQTEFLDSIRDGEQNDEDETNIFESANVFFENDSPDSIFCKQSILFYDFYYFKEVYSSKIEDAEYQFGQDTPEFRNAFLDIDQSLNKLINKLDNTTLLVILGSPSYYSPLAEIKSADFFRENHRDLTLDNQSFFFVFSKQQFIFDPILTSNPLESVNSTSIASTLASITPSFPFPQYNWGTNLFDFYPSNTTYFRIFKDSIETLASLISSSQKDVVDMKDLILLPFEEKLLKFKNEYKLMERDANLREDSQIIIDLIYSVQLAQKQLISYEQTEDNFKKISLSYNLLAFTISGIIILNMSSLIFRNNRTLNNQQQMIPSLVSSSSTESLNEEQQQKQLRRQILIFIPITLLLLLLLFTESTSDTSILTSLVPITISQLNSTDIPCEQGTSNPSKIHQNPCIPLSNQLNYKLKKIAQEIESDSQFSALEIILFSSQIVFLLEWYLSTLLTKSPYKTKIFLMSLYLSTTILTPSTYCGTLGLIGGVYLRVRFGFPTNKLLQSQTTHNNYFGGRKLNIQQICSLIIFIILSIIRFVTFDWFSPILDLFVGLIVILGKSNKELNRATFFLLIFAQYAFNLTFESLEFPFSAMYTFLIFNASLFLIMLYLDLYKQASVTYSFIQVVVINLILAIFSSLLICFTQIDSIFESIVVLTLFYLPSIIVIALHQNRIPKIFTASTSTTLHSETISSTESAQRIINQEIHPIQNNRNQNQLFNSLQVTHSIILSHEEIDHNTVVQDVSPELQTSHSNNSILQQSMKQKNGFIFDYFEIIIQEFSESAASFQFFTTASILLISSFNLIRMLFKINSSKSPSLITDFHEANLDTYLFIQNIISLIAYSLISLCTTSTQAPNSQPIINRN